MSTAGKPRHGDQKRAVGERRRTAIEQAIARDWSAGRIVTELHVTVAEYDTVRAAMDDAVNTA